MTPYLIIGGLTIAVLLLVVSNMRLGKAFTALELRHRDLRHEYCELRHRLGRPVAVEAGEGADRRRVEYER